MNSRTIAALSVLGLGAGLSLSAVQPSLAAGHAPATTARLAAHAATGKTVTFSMLRSTGVVAANCLTNASATVSIKPGSQVDKMTIKATGLVPKSEYDVFLTQLPNAPFGVSWYQGDLESDQYGNATGHYAGRFSVETFAVAPGVGQAPVVFQGDGNQNVASPPIHEYHVGIWFGSADTAVKAGCPNTVTPFNGEHNAGIQALSTRNFDDLDGPLRQVG